VLRGRISEVLARIVDRELKGEVVIVLQGASETSAEIAELLPKVEELVARGVRKRDAAREVARANAASANDLYRALLLSRQAGVLDLTEANDEPS
jgi:16S rRNA (cytidine1402-2'-O)-methyltransferase